MALSGVKNKFAQDEKKQQNEAEKLVARLQDEIKLLKSEREEQVEDFQVGIDEKVAAYNEFLNIDESRQLKAAAKDIGVEFKGNPSDKTLLKLVLLTF